jgi:hypothetical protein
MSQSITGGALPALPVPATVAPGRAQSVASALLAAVLAAAVGAGAALGPAPYLLLVAAAQAILIAAWWTAVRPPGRTAAAVVAGGAAAAADLVVLRAGGGTLEPVVGVVAIAFVATVVAQLARGVGRAGVTESFGSTMLLTVCCTALTGPLALHLRPGGPGIIAVCLAAAGAGMAAAHLADAVSPAPELSPGTGRGGIGVALGGAAGAFAAGVVAGMVTEDLTPVVAALLGGVVALTAVLVGVGWVCAVVGRERAGERVPASWATTALGPAWGIVAAAVGAYVIGNVVLG